MTVTVQEIVDALNGVYLTPDGIDANAWIATLQSALAARIEREGIAPPDGYAIVPIITESTPFSCGINGDPPQVDNAWTPPCKVWCGRKQCAAKESP